MLNMTQAEIDAAFARLVTVADMGDASEPLAWLAAAIAPMASDSVRLAKSDRVAQNV